MKDQTMKLYGKITRQLMSRYIDSSDADQNIVFSPLSVLMLLGILTDASDGQTRKEIVKILGCEEDPTESTHWLHDVQEELTKNGALKSSNAVCVNASLKNKITSGFEEHIRNLFGACLFASEDLVNDVNHWAFESTNGMIKQIADESMTDMLACLMNTLAFEARWDREYEAEDIVPADFHNADKSSNEVSMMKSTELRYIEDAHFIGFTKPYKGVGYSFMALLPRKDDSGYLKKAVRKVNFSSLYRSRRNDRVIALIPEYRFEFGDIMNEFFEELGVRTAFSERAAFSPMIDAWLKIERIVHKAFIQVDRNGTKAAAASAALCGAGGGPWQAYKFVKLNKPFLFAIMHDDSCLPVFVGAVNHLEHERFEVDGFEPQDHHFKDAEEREQYAKVLYRKLAHLLHPDVNPLYETSTEIQDLYRQLWEFYRIDDVRGLEIIEHRMNALFAELGLDGDEIEKKWRKNKLL